MNGMLNPNKPPMEAPITYFILNPLYDPIMTVIFPHEPVGAINFWELHKHHIGALIDMFH